MKENKELDGQMSIYDLCPDMRPVPELWDCMKTCKNCGIYMDHFPNGGDRCRYGDHLVGTSGKDTYDVVENNIVKMYCRFYERSEIRR